MIGGIRIGAKMSKIQVALLVGLAIYALAIGAILFDVAEHAPFLFLE